MNVNSVKKGLKLSPLMVAILVLGVASVMGAVILLWTSSAVSQTIQVRGLTAQTIQAGSFAQYATSGPALTLATQQAGPAGAFYPVIGAGSQDMIVCLDTNNFVSEGVQIDVSVKDHTTNLPYTAFTVTPTIVDFWRAASNGEATKMVGGFTTISPTSFSVSYANLQKITWENLGVIAHPCTSGNSLILSFVFPPTYGPIATQNLDIVVTISAITA